MLTHTVHPCTTSNHVHTHVDFMYIHVHPDLLITLPDSPEVMDVQFRFDVFLAIVGYEGDFEGVVSHEVEGLSDLWYG